MPNLGGPELVILVFILGLGILPLLFGVLALVDIAQRPDAQFAQAGQDRTTWLIVAVVSLFVPCVFVASAYYLFAIRPKLQPPHTA